MKPVLVFNRRNLELLGVVHNWRESVTTGEMNSRCLLVTDAHFSPRDILGEDLNCTQCESFDKCFPKLLVKLPDKEEV